MKCYGCDHDETAHDKEKNVCMGDITCPCWKFEGYPTASEIDRYMAQIELQVDKMKWVLENLKYFRNYNNKELVIAWWRDINHIDLTKTLLTRDLFFKLDEPESITRAHRKCVEMDRQKYGEFEPTLTEQKSFKQFAIEEFMVMSNIS